MSKTFIALLARGVSSEVAQQLTDKGYTIEKLKTCDEPLLLGFGLSQEQASELLGETRPPIPDETVFQILHKSRRVCCICREPSRGIIIHHIKKWAESRSHDIDNLALLCLLHHDDAHTHKELTMKLSGEQIREQRDRWYSEVERKDALAILNLVEINGSIWHYFNHKRLYELLRELPQFPQKTFHHYSSLRQRGIIEDDGTMLDLSAIVDSQTSSHMYQSGLGNALYLYHKELFEFVLKQLPVTDVSGMAEEEIIASVHQNQWIAQRGWFYFKRGKKTSGIGQTRTSKSRNKFVELQFEFDAWETVSDSSWGAHLSGQSSCIVIARVRSIEKDQGKILLKCSCLAICDNSERSLLRNLSDTSNSSNIFDL